MADKPLTADLALLLSEHRELLNEISDFQEWADQVEELGIPHFGEMGLRLSQLRDRLRKHFADEEQGGYLAPIVKAAPQFADDVAVLAQQHRRILELLDDFIARLQAPEPPFASWQTAVQEYDGILTELLQHESRENAIVRAVSNQR